MNTLIEQRQKIIDMEAVICKDKTKCKNYSEAIALHDKMVTKGWTTYRGNRLLPIEKKIKTYIQINR